MKYKKVNIIGSKYFHIFKREDGSEFQVETNANEYADLAKANPINPTHSEGLYVGSYARNRYDSNDGDLHPGEYADSGDGINIEMHLDDGNVHSVEKEKMVNGLLIDRLILKRKKFHIPESLFVDL